jgi:predicted AAA+ superfamily ATPase
MVNRLSKILINNSFFLFGARGVGKTYWLEQILPKNSTHIINLLDPLEEEKFLLDPGELLKRIEQLKENHTHIMIDEIQKAPKLLDLVQHAIEKTDLVFALTGSSARKLKRGGANLLAGRAFTYYFYPFSHRELADDFDLNFALRWGTLPKVCNLTTDEERQLYLRSYVNTYLKEEIAEEQIVRKLDPFRKFLQIASQSSGTIINFSKIAKDTGVSIPTVQTYFQILEDTLLGTILSPFHESIRKRQFENPRFYFFDNGVRRALDRTITIDLIPQTSAYGVAFEHFIVNEIIKLKAAKNLDFELSYLRTYGDAEIDLIIERPGLPRALIEIKSKTHISDEDVRHLQSLGPDIPNSESFCLSNDPNSKKIGSVACLPWQTGLIEIGL